MLPIIAKREDYPSSSSFSLIDHNHNMPGKPLTVYAPALSSPPVPAVLTRWSDVANKTTPICIMLRGANPAICAKPDETSHAKAVNINRRASEQLEPREMRGG
jgi:hypothetical protein